MEIYRAWESASAVGTRYGIGRQKTMKRERESNEYERGYGSRAGGGYCHAREGQQCAIAYL
jgi:hypothetical protein